MLRATSLEERGEGKKKKKRKRKRKRKRKKIGKSTKEDEIGGDDDKQSIITERKIVYYTCNYTTIPCHERIHDIKKKKEEKKYLSSFLDVAKKFFLSFTFPFVYHFFSYLFFNCKIGKISLDLVARGSPSSSIQSNRRWMDETKVEGFFFFFFFSS